MGGDAMAQDRAGSARASLMNLGAAMTRHAPQAPISDSTVSLGQEALAQRAAANCPEFAIEILDE